MGWREEKRTLMCQPYPANPSNSQPRQNLGLPIRPKIYLKTFLGLTFLGLACAPTEFHNSSVLPDVENSCGLLSPGEGDGFGRVPLGIEVDPWSCDDDGDDSDASSSRFPNPIITLSPPSTTSVHASRTSCTATGAASTKPKTESIRRMQATILYRRIFVGYVTWISV
jgi:hypothetical protein